MISGGSTYKKLAKTCGLCGNKVGRHSPHIYGTKNNFFLKKKPVYNETQDRMEQIPPKKIKKWFFSITSIEKPFSGV